MTHSTRTILTAQRLGSGRMAALVTGSFGLLTLGPAPEFLHHRGQTFLAAWPVAVLFALAVGPLAFKRAARINRIFG